eukprot:TRINITY_DN10624_c0_g1_i1.p1 TRINITY_DN10624_c0_g1~~TRINITY_DN10624_c0_g1_i1.p1  ORF type:complete len:208 (+),score=58.38 TRINITY_DN10624_c0_g1_i1:69-692(+)
MLSGCSVRMIRRLYLAFAAAWLLVFRCASSLRLAEDEQAHQIGSVDTYTVLIDGRQYNREDLRQVWLAEQRARINKEFDTRLEAIEKTFAEERASVNQQQAMQTNQLRNQQEQQRHLVLAAQQQQLLEMTQQQQTARTSQDAALKNTFVDQTNALQQIHQKQKDKTVDKMQSQSSALESQRNQLHQQRVMQAQQRRIAKSKNAKWVQ